MKLSEQLKQDHDCGDFGKALEGYSNRAAKLEHAAFARFYFEAYDNGKNPEECRAYADKQVNEI